jgi:hypothetical protein
MIMSRRQRFFRRSSVALNAVKTLLAIIAEQLAASRILDRGSKGRLDSDDLRSAMDEIEIEATDAEIKSMLDEASGRGSMVDMNNFMAMMRLAFPESFEQCTKPEG